jgi:hypothetical protein
MKKNIPFGDILLDMIHTFEDLIQKLQKHNSKSIIVFRKGLNLAYPIKRYQVPKDYDDFQPSFLHCGRWGHNRVGLNFTYEKQECSVELLLKNLEEDRGKTFSRWKGGIPLIIDETTSIYVGVVGGNVDMKMQIKEEKDCQLFIDLVHPPWLPYDQDFEFYWDDCDPRYEGKWYNYPDWNDV